MIKKLFPIGYDGARRRSRLGFEGKFRRLGFGLRKKGR